MGRHHYTIINILRRIRLYTKVNLAALHQQIPNSKYYPGRPQMLVIKMSNQRNLQIFSNGTVQILGALSHSSAQSMRLELQKLLRRIWKREKCVMSNLTVDNMVISTQLSEHISFSNIRTSSYNLCYEPELFPAALISRWLPIHVAVFHNSKVIITGLKSELQADMILDFCVVSIVKTMPLLRFA